MLRIGPDWEFPLDPEHSRVWLSPKGLWGIEVVCPETKVETSDNLGATLAPRLSIQDLGSCCLSKPKIGHAVVS